MATHPVPTGVPVRAWHVESMGDRMAASARDRAFESLHGIDTPSYLRALRAHNRQGKALRRLAEALEWQPGAAR